MARKENKVYVVDTSALMHDPNIIDQLSEGGNIVVLPYAVIEELDGLKKGNGRAAVAREVARVIDDYREKGLKIGKTLSDGVPTSTGGKLFVDHSDDWASLPVRIEPNNDGRVLLVAKKWEGKKKGDVIVVSRDILLRVKADACRIPAETTHFDSSDNGYTGRTCLELSAETALVLQTIARWGFVVDSEFAGLDLSKILPNQCVDICYGNKHCLAIRKLGRFVWVKKPNVNGTSSGIHPVNNEQAYAKALLDDPTISLVTLSGKAGTGKTLISLLSALNQVTDRENGYQRIQVYRPNIEIGPSLGFLPGYIEEKFAPWTLPILDNMTLILEARASGQCRTVEDLIGDNVLDISPLLYIRGRSLINWIVLVDEAQNLTPHEAKTMLTRSGVNTKFIMTGDPDQIDNPYVDRKTNGLTYTVEKLKGENSTGHVTLIQGERSPLAELVANLL